MSEKTPLRNMARNQHCVVRLPGICNGDPATVVLAHLRRSNVAGMGQKPPDICGVWACYDCHNEIDRRTTKLDRTELDAHLLGALCRQLTIYWKEGVIKL